MDRERRFDVVALVLAGFVNTLLAPLVFGVVLRPGTIPGERSAVDRAVWIAEHAARWQAGWTFWFVVTLTFAWSFFALGRNIEVRQDWIRLALGLALLAAAVDLVGIVLNLSAVTDLAAAPRADEPGTGAAETLFGAQTFAHGLTDIAAFGLYSVAGLALLPALFADARYPRKLAWLGAAEWGIAAVATGLLALDVPGAAAVAAIGFALYAPWVWLSAAWLAGLRR